MAQVREWAIAAGGARELAEGIEAAVEAAIWRLEEFVGEDVARNWDGDAPEWLTAARDAVAETQASARRCCLALDADSARKELHAAR